MRSYEAIEVRGQLEFARREAPLCGLQDQLPGLKPDRCPHRSVLFLCVRRKMHTPTIIAH